MRKWLVRILLISSAICLAACSQPVGTLYNSGADGDENGMFVIANRYIYQLDDRFMRYEDFNIYVVENGNIFGVDVTTKGIEVAMIYNKGLSVENRVELTTALSVQLYTVGRVIVEVTLPASLGYFKADGTPRSAQYSIEVFSPNNGGGSNGDGGIGIIWNE